MRALNTEKFICFDLETTGLDPTQDAIIEIAAITFDFNKHHDSYETLVDPCRLIPQESMEIHHITGEMVQGKPKIETLLNEFFEFVGDLPIVGHMISQDVKFLEAAAKDHLMPFPIKHNPIIDTLRLARLYGECRENSLQKLREHFHIPLIGEAHRARSDVLANIEVFKFLTTNFKSTQDILKCLSRPILLKRMPLGAHKGKFFSELPHKYLKWVSKWDFDLDLKYSIESELKRRKENPDTDYYPFKDLL